MMSRTGSVLHFVERHSNGRAITLARENYVYLHHNAPRNNRARNSKADHRVGEQFNMRNNGETFVIR